MRNKITKKSDRYTRMLSSSTQSVSIYITARRLRLFAHIVLGRSIAGSFVRLTSGRRPFPADWQRLRGRSRRRWLLTIEPDLRKYNINVNSTCQRVQDRSRWR